MQTNDSNTAHSHALTNALSQFVKNMDSACFKLIVVNEQGLISHLYGNMEFSKKFHLKEAQNWQLVAERIEWEKYNSRGMITMGDSVYNLVK
ncbi:MAG: hypothetical protein MI866_09235 [Bacteroidales bacterium]|nr:hypothetical protein [Bacteroidales bacterium]